MPVHKHPLKERVRAKANHYVTGRDGGRDIDLRQFALDGMRLYGRLTDIRETRLQFAADLLGRRAGCAPHRRAHRSPYADRLGRRVGTCRTTPERVGSGLVIHTSA